MCFPCSVFWDLYCAAPERRDSCEHSSEAKAFHDYVSISSTALSISTQFYAVLLFGCALCINEQVRAG